MADPVLHIKDSYYFEIPKALWRWDAKSKADFPNVYIKLDPNFQHQEAHHLVESLQGMGVDAEVINNLESEWAHWQHQGPNHGKPFDVFLEEHRTSIKTEYDKWKKSKEHSEKTLSDFDKVAHPEQGWFALKMEDSNWAAEWKTAKQEAGGREAVAAYKQDDSVKWSQEKIKAYNKSLHGKILIPQVFGGELRNFYQRESGFCVSKFMIIEVVVALIIVGLFAWLGSKVKSGERPKGRLWNFLEVFLVFLRDQVARPAIGGHDADKFVPLLWTIFLFVLGCNLMGMLPWAGAPTGAFAVTLGMAMVTFAAVVVSGSQKFGVVGFWKNQVPSMDLPIVLAVLIVPLLFCIEVLGLFIKHGVLGIRLLANMMAGHLVLLGVMGLAFSLEGAVSSSWPIAAVFAVIGSTLFSCLELFVAFLQAYIFTFLSALFIGAAVHRH